MSIAERFVNKTKVTDKLVTKSSEDVDILPDEFEKFGDELFEKIANIKYWAEFDFQKQCSMIQKFLSNKGVSSPAIFAKLLQNSMLGFGVFDKYLKNADIDGIIYEKNKSLHCVKNGILVSIPENFSADKVALVYKNIMNIAGFDGKNKFYQFRIFNYWIEIDSDSKDLQKLSIFKVTDKFLVNQLEKFSEITFV